MEIEFYLQEMISKNLKGEVVKKEDVLFFKLSRPAIRGSGPNAPDTSFDGVATRDHLIQYKDAYRRFKKENPDFKCRWPELEVSTEPPKEPKIKKNKKAAAAPPVAEEVAEVEPENERLDEPFSPDDQ